MDKALGFDRFVHLYLVEGPERLPKLPILQTQLQPSESPPYPHLALELETEGLEDADCTICNWNLAVSRPGVPGVCRGGNWTRGTDPERIAEVWEEFRARGPSPDRARGFFNTGLVPTLTGDQISENLRLLRKAPRMMPELMLKGSVPLSRFRRVATPAVRSRRRSAGS